MSDGYGLELLGFGPHPDDIELFCGGLFARARELGYRTGVVDMTRGEKGSRGTPELRAAEAEAAGRALGLTLRENLGLPDGWLNPWEGFDGDDAARAKRSPVAKVLEVLRRLRPEIVVVPHERESHPDHAATSAIVTRALFFGTVWRIETDPPTEPFAPRQVLYYPMRQLSPVSLVVDVTAAHAKKMEAIGCYQSQVASSEGAPATLVGSALSLSSLVARDRFYGAQIGVAYGEPYLTREMLGLHDPVDHFRRNAFARPLFLPYR